MAKKALLLLLLFGICFFFGYIASTSIISEIPKEKPSQEFQLLSVSIEHRPITNSLGKVIRTEDHLHYSFSTSSGEVIIKEKKMHKNYDGTTYILEFKKGDENKILQYDGYQTRLIFIMTDEMYKQLFKTR